MKLVVISLLGPSGTLMLRGTEVCSVSCVLTDPHFLEHPQFVRAGGSAFLGEVWWQ